jgi:VWFA-related protein
VYKTPVEVLGHEGALIRRRAFSPTLALLCCALLVVLAGVPGFSQSSPPKLPAVNQAGPQPAVLRISTRMVQVNVIVQDRDGNPITGLTKDDFTVLDKNQPQRISFFAEQSFQPAPASTLTADAVAPIHSFSNRPQSGGSTSSGVSVILLDTVNIDWDPGTMPFPYARSQVIKFIKNMQPGDQVALYLLAPSRLYMLHDFTSDSAALLEVMTGADKSKTSSDPKAAAAEIQHKRMEKEASDAFAESSQFYKGDRPNRVAATSQGMITIAARLAKFPGRKNLIWISSAFPIQTGLYVGSQSDQHNYAGDISSVGQALSNADVAVYPVDARGLIGPDVMGQLQGAQYGSRAPVLTSAAPDDRPFETMISLAAGTGGKAYFNTNDLSGSIRHAIDDSRITYVLGYYPDHNKWDGSFREITVKVNRPGVQLRYRKGYFATEEGGDTADAQKQLLSTALRSPVQIMDLGLEVEINPAGVSSARQIRAQIHVLPGQLHFEKNGDRWSDGLEIAWAEFSADGREVGHGAHALGIKPARAGYDEIVQKGLIFSERVTVNREAAEMRLVVRDTGSGAMGSVNIPLGSVFAPNSAPAPAKK